MPIPAIPLGRIGQALDTAPIATFLASDDPHWLTSNPLQAFLSASLPCSFLGRILAGNPESANSVRHLAFMRQRLFRENHREKRWPGCLIGAPKAAARASRTPGACDRDCGPLPPTPSLRSA